MVLWQCKSTPREPLILQPRPLLIDPSHQTKVVQPCSVAFQDQSTSTLFALHFHLSIALQRDTVQLLVQPRWLLEEGCESRPYIVAGKTVQIDRVRAHGKHTLKRRLATAVCMCKQTKFANHTFLMQLCRDLASCSSQFSTNTIQVLTIVFRHSE